jgi:hypothetical protein
MEMANLSGVSATDWSWGALIFDFDNDGWKDIFVSNGIYRDIMYLDFTNFINDAEEVKKIVEEKGTFDWRDFAKYMPSTPIPNYAFVNNGDLTFKNRSGELGLGDPGFSNGSAYGDIDNDGDLDLIVNNVNMPCFIYENQTNDQKVNNFLKIRLKGNGMNRFGIGAQVEITMADQHQVLQHYTSRGFESSVEPGLIFGLGEASHIDELTVIWPDKRMQTLNNLEANQTIELSQAEANSIYVQDKLSVTSIFTDNTEKILQGDSKHQENRYNDFDHEQLLPHMLSTQGPRIVHGDVNGDQLDDFVLLGAANDPDKLFIQQSDGTFKPSMQQVFEKDQALESTCGILFDPDSDGDMDLLVGAGGNEYQKGIENFILRYYENDGLGNFTRVIEKTPPAAGNFSCIVAGDLEGDGDPDLFIGGSCVPGNYGLPPRSFLFRNDGNGRWTDVIPNNLGNFGMVTDAVWNDFDGDQDNDLILVGEWMPIMILVNDKGRIVDRKMVPESFGLWTAIEAGDLDRDGDLDFVVGNWGLNSKMKASSERPLTMFVKDFDNNNKSEFIINWYAPEDEQSYPLATKMDLVQQLPYLKKSILKYEDYAHKTYETLFSEAERKDAMTYVVNDLETSVLWNEKSTLRLEALPLSAQISPVFAIVADDLNDDGLVDIWLGGNFYGLKPQFGRHDSSKGVFLKGDTNGKFTELSPAESGISVSGEVRDAWPFLIKGKKHLLVARNNDSALIFSH